MLIKRNNVLHDDNPRPHTARITIKRKQTGTQFVSSAPLQYLSDLPPTDYDFFCLIVEKRFDWGKHSLVKIK